MVGLLVMDPTQSTLLSCKWRMWTAKPPECPTLLPPLEHVETYVPFTRIQQKNHGGISPLTYNRPW